MACSRGLRRSPVVVLLGLIALVFTACSAGAQPAGLRLVGDGIAMGLGTTNKRPGVPITFITYDVCAASKPITVRRIRLDHAVGLVYVTWVQRENPPPPGITDRPGEHDGLPSLMQGFNRHPISTKCSGNDHSTEIDLAVKTTAANGRFNGYWIDYRGGSLYVPFGFSACATVCPPGFSPGGGP